MLPAEDEEPQEELAREMPPLTEFPLALRRMHQRLNSKLELYKLHVKHYHMSPAQFRRRTSELHLPAEVYDKYENVCKTCKVCAEGAPKPFRSHISGLRANNFGDLVFVDHCEVEFQGSHHVVLMVLDGATNLLWACPQRSKSNEETTDILREWMDNFQCVPRCLVSDMGFVSTMMDKFYRHWGIHHLATGPRTPWPNRAEAAVRLFKRTFYLPEAANRRFQPQASGRCADQRVGHATPSSQ